MIGFMVFPRTMESSISTIFLSRKFSVISPNFLATPSFRNLVLGCINVLPTYLFLQSTSPYGMFNWKTRTSRFFLCVLRGRISAPFQMEFMWLFSQFWKKIPIFKKKNFFFLKIGILIQSTHTQATWWRSPPIICVTANLFFSDQKWHNCAL